MSQREDPRAFIANRDLFGGLADHDPLRHRIPVRLTSLHQRGARGTLRSLV